MVNKLYQLCLAYLVPFLVIYRKGKQIVLLCFAPFAKILAFFGVKLSRKDKAFYRKCFETSIPLPAYFANQYDLEDCLYAPKAYSDRINAYTDSYSTARDEAYKGFVENEFLSIEPGKFSTFSIDVDTAAYTTMRRYVNEMKQRPPAMSVRLEEYVNYFKYGYALPEDGKRTPHRSKLYDAEF